MDDEKIRVLYIAGSGRSGSTLVELALGQHPAFISVGEIRHLWRNKTPDVLCGCGSPLRVCNFWSKVFDQAFDGIEHINFEAMYALQRKIDRIRFIPKYYWPGLRNADFQEAFSEYTSILIKIYTAIFEVSGNKIIIDSSKDISFLYLLNLMKGFTLHILHLVRDSRGVAYSWHRRKKEKPEVTEDKKFMPVQSPSKIAIEWTYREWFIHFIQKQVAGYSFMKYDDFILKPRLEMLKVIRDLGIQNQNLDFVGESWIDIKLPNHTVSGNPIRFESGKIELRLDTEWQQKFDRWNKSLVTLLTWPYLKRYGYL